MPTSRRSDTLSHEEKREAARKALEYVFPEYEFEEFDETYKDGTARIRIGLKWFQIDPSEGWE